MNYKERFVVRFAEDVHSDPMTSDDLITALEEGRLLREWLFAEVGKDRWLPLTFVAGKADQERRKKARESLLEQLSEIGIKKRSRMVRSIKTAILGVVGLLFGIGANIYPLIAFGCFLIALATYFNIRGSLDDQLQRISVLLQALIDQSE